MKPQTLATGLPRGALGPRSPNSKWDERSITLADPGPNRRNLPAGLPAEGGRGRGGGRLALRLVCPRAQEEGGQGALGGGVVVAACPLP